MRQDTDKAFITAFGKNLRRVRRSKDLTQEALSFRTGLTMNQIGRIERGEINTSIGIIHRISEGLEIEVKELFEFPEDLK